MIKSHIRRGLVCAALAGLAGCGSGPQSARSSQVVATVDNRELTVSQLDEVLAAREPAMITPVITREAIDSLIDEELLMRDALKNSFDRDPAVVRAIEAARRRILAQTFAERVLFPKAPATPRDEEAYFTEHPELFENRRVFKLTVFALRSSELSDELRGELNGPTSAEQLRKIMDRHEIPFETRQMSAASEDLPMEQLSGFAKATEGDVLIANTADGNLLLMCVAAADQSPVTLEQARPMIAQYLRSARNAKAVEDHLKATKAVASISYRGSVIDSAVNPAAKVN